ncbi:ADP-ribose glycohydrolase MACROD1 isoform X2 [Eublepharis macularius]|uniref:ADP-ribose glycohydrolase MACROD1 isoform X2 n=1 Tax=Eublepharis macularius TaxID=481883 RepID=A0AA97K3T8_EUBMA|nr:ADP-ribose glycohydrolase MACROD1 isoform X2 [Eublepharis macularius]
MPGFLMPLRNSRLSGALGRLWRVWGSCPIALQGGGRKGACSGGRVPSCSVPKHWVFTKGIRSWAAAPLLAMAAKVDLTSCTDWKEAKSFLKGLNAKQRRDHYFTKDFIKLKQIPTWKEMAKSARLKPPEETAYSKDNHLNEKISLFRGDITKLEVDAVVNAANSSLLGGGGVDGCIHRAAGHLLKEECRTLNGCETGKAKISCGYRLPAKNVIHTVGPIAQGEPSATQEAELSNCYKNSLKLAVENKLRTVAFPCISTGVFGYPNEAAAKVVLNTLRQWLEENKEKVDRIILCVFLDTDEMIYKEKLPEIFPIA